MIQLHERDGNRILRPLKRSFGKVERKKREITTFKRSSRVTRVAWRKISLVSPLPKVTNSLRVTGAGDSPSRV